MTGRNACANDEDCIDNARVHCDHDALCFGVAWNPGGFGLKICRSTAMAPKTDWRTMFKLADGGGGGEVKCWGSVANGRLGDNGVYMGGSVGEGPGEMGNALAAANLGAGRTAVQISLGFVHTRAVESFFTIPYCHSLGIHCVGKKLGSEE